MTLADSAPAPPTTSKLNARRTLSTTRRTSRAEVTNHYDIAGSRRKFTRPLSFKSEEVTRSSEKASIAACSPCLCLRRWLCIVVGYGAPMRILKGCESVSGWRFQRTRELSTNLVAGCIASLVDKSRLCLTFSPGLAQPSSNDLKK